MCKDAELNDCLMAYVTSPCWVMRWFI